jgi:hypothetical protein
MFGRITVPLLFAGLSFVSSSAYASDQCDNFDLSKASGVVKFQMKNDFMPTVDIIGDGPVQMYSAPMKGCEIREAVIPANLKDWVSADAAYNGWVSVTFPVPGDVATYSGWIDARRIAFSKHQLSPDLPVYDAEVDHVFTHSRISGPNP